MKGKKSENLTGYKLLTPERLRQFPGLEKLPEDEARKVIESLEQLIFGSLAIIITSINFKKYSFREAFSSTGKSTISEHFRSLDSYANALSNNLEGNKNGETKLLSDLPDLVVPTGIEPASKV